MASEIRPSTLSALLGQWPVARLATSNEDGSPHLVPIVFCHAGAELYSPIDGKRKKGGRLQRVRNLSSHSSFSLLLDHYDADWRQLWWVRLDGEAEPFAPSVEHARQLTELLEAKYPQYGDVPVLGEEPLCLRLRWQRVSAWAERDIDEAIRASLSAQG
ncbi:MAG: TIGR03668 family PPOX class F420-dependent oxidoreductase [Gammaproteobacteria bacterium]|nr:TIGR03668 family PPOX class F420-dependent oxidoreductase [Gammaproteobacteria bacterium]